MQLRWALLLCWLLALPAAGHAQSLLLLGAGGSGATGCSFPLPNASNTAVYAYGLRKLSSTATKAVQLRRASDSTTSDIAFTGCNLDTASANTFCNATTCFCRIMYDQSGNGADANQTATTSRQPTYSSSDLNSKPSCLFVKGSLQNLVGTLAGAITQQTISVVASQHGSATFPALWSTGSTASTGATFFLNATNMTCRGSASSGVDATLAAPTTDTLAQMSCTAATNLQHIAVNGTAGTDNTSAHTITSQSVFAVGAFDQSNNNTWDGRLNELIAFAPNISNGDLATLASNQKTYWGTP